jgi:RNA polymerase sigma-70 factor, ECF subfamily
MAEREHQAEPHTCVPEDADAALLRAVRGARGTDPAVGFHSIEALLTPRLRRYFRSHGFPPEDSEDLVQEVLARAWRGLPRLQQEESFLQWLFVIASNVRRTARARRLRERRHVVGGAALSEELADPRTASFHREGRGGDRRDAMRAAIEELPGQQRQCLLLRVRDELSYEEIAATLRLSLNTVRNHLAAAKRTLRRRLALPGEERR